MTLSLYFEDQLRQYLPIVVEEVHPERQMTMGIPGALAGKDLDNTIGYQILPFHTELAPWKREFTYSVVSGQGIAEFYTHASDDIPMVSLGADQMTGFQRDIAIGYNYTFRDLQASQSEGMNIVGKHIEQARIGTDIKLEDIYYLGDATHRLTGLLNFPGTTTVTLPADGAGSSTTLASKNAEQKYRDISFLSTLLSNNSRNAFQATALLVPLAVFNDLNNALMGSSANNGDSVLTVYNRNQRNNPSGGVQIIPVPYLTNQAVLYKKDPKCSQAYISDYFHAFPNQPSNTNGDAVNFKYSVDIISTCGGTVVYKPMSLIVVNGI